MRRLLHRFGRYLVSRSAYKFLIRDWVALDDLDSCAAVLGTMRFSRNLEPLEIDVPRGRRVVVVAPHPDDEMIGPGGTLIKALAGGAAVEVLYLTRDAGEPGLLREAETLTVARKMGFTPHFFSFPAGALPVDSDAAAALAERIAAWQPDTLFIPFLCDDHPEHRAASRLLLLAADAGALQPDIEVWAYQVYTSLLPNVVVDITAVAKRKAAAIALWRDTAMKERDWCHYALGLNAYNSRFLRKPPGPHYAEAFFVVPLTEYVALCRTYFDRDYNTG